MPCLQLLKCIAMDVATRGRLGVCVAIRVPLPLDALTSTLRKKHEDVNPLYCKGVVEASLLAIKESRRSQQKFLDPDSKDTELRPATRGLGGNRVLERCIVIQQNHFEEHIVDRIRPGELPAHFCMCTINGLLLEAILPYRMFFWHRVIARFCL